METETNTIGDYILDGLTSIASFGSTLIYLTYSDGDCKEVEEYDVYSLHSIELILLSNSINYTVNYLADDIGYGEDYDGEWEITIN